MGAQAISPLTQTPALAIHKKIDPFQDSTSGERQVQPWNVLQLGLQNMLHIFNLSNAKATFVQSTRMQRFLKII